MGDREIKRDPLIERVVVILEDARSQVVRAPDRSEKG